MHKHLLLFILGYSLSCHTIYAQTPAAEGTFQIIVDSEKLIDKVTCPLAMRIQIEDVRVEDEDIMWKSGDWNILILSEEKVNMGMKLPPYSCVEPIQTIEEIEDEK